MSDNKDTKKPAPKHKGRARLELPHFYDEAEPTVFKGGVARMIEIWNDMRAMNTGAYGSGPLMCAIDGWRGSGKTAKYPVTACSPFTANVIGILFDPQGTARTVSKPMFHNGTKPLPSLFCLLHNGRGDGPMPKGVRLNSVKSSAESIMLFNLGYEVQPKDLRRGDMVGIDWGTGGGHAVFVWDVHMADLKEGSDYQEVDAFCFVSANGAILKKEGNDHFCCGPGISIGGCDDRNYLSGSNRFWKEEATDKRGLTVSPQKSPFFQDRPEHITDATWHCIPGKTQKDINRETWAGLDKKHAPNPKDTSAKGKHYVRSMRAVRLWGMAPPERHGETEYEQTQFELAKKLAYETPPKSYATGTPTVAPPTFENVPVTIVKGDVEKAKDSPPKKAEQPKKEDKFSPQQKWIEKSLGRLFDAGWLKTDPGDRNNPNDAESKAAIKEFKDKWKCTDHNLRDTMEQALTELAAGKPDPHAPKPPAPKTRVDRIVWLKNRSEKGGAMYFSVHGHVEKLDRLNITFTCKKTKKTFTMPADIELDDTKVIQRPIGLPEMFEDGSELVATFAGTSQDGVAIRYEAKAPIYIGPPMIMFALE